MCASVCVWRDLELFMELIGTVIFILKHPSFPYPWGGGGCSGGLDQPSPPPTGPVEFHLIGQVMPHSHFRRFPEDFFHSQASAKFYEMVYFSWAPKDVLPMQESPGDIGSK